MSVIYYLLGRRPWQLYYSDSAIHSTQSFNQILSRALVLSGVQPMWVVSPLYWGLNCIQWSPFFSPQILQPWHTVSRLTCFPWPLFVFQTSITWVTPTYYDMFAFQHEIQFWCDDPKGILPDISTSLVLVSSQLLQVLSPIIPAKVSL